MMTSTPPTVPARRRSVWSELRGTALLVALVLIGLGMVQIWRGWLAPYACTVRVDVEPNRTGLDDSAEWLFRRLEYVLVSPEGGPPLALLSHGPGAERVQQLKVRGRRMRELIAQERLEGFLRYPGYAGDELSVRLRYAPAGPDTLRHELTQEQARSFLESPVRTYVSVRDQYGRPVSELRSVLGFALQERAREPGVYDLAIRVDELIWLLEEQGTYTLQVRSGTGPEAPQLLEVPAQWFIREGRESRVLSLALGKPSAGDVRGASNPSAGSGAEPAAAAPIAPVNTPSNAQVNTQSIARVDAPAIARVPAQPPAVASAAPAASAAPPEGTIEIRALPYANYYVDGKLQASNVALTRVTVEPGLHAVRVEHPLFWPHEWTGVRVERGAVESLFHAFPSDATGSIRVAVSRGWGQVYLDGKDTGASAPCMLESIRIGTRTVALWRGGQPVPGAQQTVVVTEGGAVEVLFELP